MDDALDYGPVELCFLNKETGHYSVFDMERLRFETKWQALVYTRTIPAPPIGFSWVYVLGTRDEVVADAQHIEMESLLQEAGGFGACESEEASCEIVLRDTDTKKQYRMFSDTRSLFCDEAAAKRRMLPGEMYSNTHGNNPWMPQFVFVIVPYHDENRLGRACPLLWGDVESTFFPDAENGGGGAL